MSAAKKTIVIQVPRQAFFDVITDYEKYPKFISSLKKAEVLKRAGSKAVVKFTASVVKTVTYTLELTEKSPSKLTWTLVEGEFMNKNTGSWTLKSLGEGETEATYEIEVGIGGFAPGFISKLLVEESLPKTLSEFKEFAESTAKKSTKKSTSKR